MDSFLFSDAVLRRFLGGLTDYAVIILDPEGEIAAWNEGAHTLTQHTAAEVMGQNFALFHPPEARAAGAPESALAEAAASGRHEEEAWRQRRDGTHFWAHVVTSAIHDEAGTLRGFGHVMQDFSARRTAQKYAESMLHLLEHTARTDYVTGLDNRRALDKALLATASAARRHGRKFCLAMLDIDQFHAFNDRFGHAAGDAYLRRAGRTFLEAMRPEDSLARYAGAEFVLLLPDTDQNGAIMCVERLSGAMLEPLTCSAGVAQWDGLETGPALLDRAAAALAQAKAAGRNRVIFSPATGRPAMEDNRADKPEDERGRTPWLRVVRRYEDVEDKEAG
jgi:diguanylate cyclase (GGDEF)-like protein/PAS domain S-box-containing protein